MKKLLSLVLALGCLGAAAPATGAQEVRVSLERGGVQASFGYGRGHGSWVGLRAGYDHCAPTHRGVRRVWVPGCVERVWQEPVYELRRDSCGNLVRVLVHAGSWRVIEHPGHWEWRRVALGARH